MTMFMHNKIFASENISDLNNVPAKGFGKTILFIGAKGGIGKTDLSANITYLASRLLDKSNDKVLVTDTDPNYNMGDFIILDSNPNKDRIKRAYDEHGTDLFLKPELLEQVITPGHILTSRKDDAVPEKVNIDILTGLSLYTNALRDNKKNTLNLLNTVQSLPNYSLKVIDTQAGTSNDIISMIAAGIQLDMDIYVVTEIAAHAHNALINQLSWVYLSVGPEQFKKAKFHFILNKYIKAPESRGKMIPAYIEMLSTSLFKMIHERASMLNKKIRLNTSNYIEELNLSKYTWECIQYDNDYHTMYTSKSLLYCRFQGESTQTGKDLFRLARQIVECVMNRVPRKSIKDVPAKVWEVWQLAFDSAAPQQTHLKWRNDITEDNIRKLEKLSGHKGLLELWKKTHRN